MVAHPYWCDKSVIVSGASSGIGQALAVYLAGLGAKVGLLARREEKLHEIAESIATSGGSAQWAVADVTDEEVTRAACEALEQKIGPCDVLIANAGIYRVTDVAQFSASAANEVLATNTSGVINLIGAVLPCMIERKSGVICGVASMAGGLGLPAAGAYCASKAAVITLLESLRVDLHSSGIQVTTVCPGFVDTPLLTEEERRDPGTLSAEDAARQICWAIERRKAEYWFPWRTRLAVRLANTLPHSWYRWVMQRHPRMEET